MKLTKGKIKKLFIKDKQSRKKYNKNDKSSTNWSNTCKSKQVFNLKNKTIKHVKL